MATGSSYQPSRLNTVSNLAVNETHDVLLVSTPNFPVGAVQFIYENTPRKITGVQKVAQMFMKILFTQKGSDPVYRNTGTNFPNLTIGANKVLSDPEFRAQILECVKDATSQVKYILNSNSVTDYNSQLDRIIFKGMETNNETLNLYLQLITKAGETAVVAVPFPQLDKTLATE